MATSIADRYNTSRQMKVNEDGSINIIDVSNLIPEKYDYIDLSYTGDDLTGVVYKTGGASGTIVATLTLSYSSGVLQSITKT